MTMAKYALCADEGHVLVAECLDLDGFFVGDWSSTDLFEQDDDDPPSKITFSLVGTKLKTDLAPYFDKSAGTYNLGDATV